MSFTAVAVLSLELLHLSEACRAVWCSKIQCLKASHILTLEICFMETNDWRTLSVLSVQEMSFVC